MPGTVARRDMTDELPNVTAYRRAKPPLASAQETGLAAHYTTVHSALALVVPTLAPFACTAAAGHVAPASDVRVTNSTIHAATARAVMTARIAATPNIVVMSVLDTLRALPVARSAGIRAVEALQIVAYRLSHPRLHVREGTNGIATGRAELFAPAPYATA